MSLVIKINQLIRKGFVQFIWQNLGNVKVGLL